MTEKDNVVPLTVIKGEDTRPILKTRMGKMPIEYRPVEATEYGFVLCMQGPLKGRVLYYDDDEGQTAICYERAPSESYAVFVPRRYLLKLDDNAIGMRRARRAKHG